MKNKYLLILILGVLIITLTGCNSKDKELNTKIDDIYPTDRDILPGNVNYYYTFTGESEHLIFDDGMANYQDDKAEFWIKNFSSKSNEEFTGKYIVSFNGKEMASGDIDNKIIEKINISELGHKIKRADDGNFYGEIDSFMMTNPDDLEKALNITVNYCNSNKKCKDEVFKINFIKHE